MISRSATIHNEQVKLTASFLNNLSLAIIVSGVLTPLFSAELKPLAVVQTSACVAVGLYIHNDAKRLLTRIKV